MNKIVALICLILYSGIATWSAINPIDRTTWLIEFLTSAVPVLILVILYIKKIRFSSWGYILMTVLPVMHVIGAHYTFANVPSQWLSDLLWTSRNMYDRIAHVSVWFYAFGIIELIDMKKLTRSWWLKLSYALFAIMALAAAYELFERWYAIISDPEAGMAILWSQGDIRDAQKDILMDTSGALFAIVLYAITHRRT
jgi:putative membrane protein